MGDLEADLRQVQRLAAQLGDLTRLAAQAAPAGGSASDDTGCAEVRIDRDGRPTSLVLRGDWRERIGPRAVGQALVAAHQRAVQRHLGDWSDALHEEGWSDRLAAVDADADAGDDDPPSFPMPVTLGDPRPLGAVLEDVLAAMDRSHRDATAPPLPDQPETLSPDSAGPVRVSLSGGGLDVHVDARWAESAETSEVNARLDSALRGAVARTEDHAADWRESLVGVDLLLGEVLGMLRDPGKVTR
ncbi:hypothetical protein [Nocardioides sp.]|uniref:hypothetical protein n=1 Tax=Nocardioides sp. TaxID=35761 RepID=UPI002627DA14|nr:hypothetical protein [Nocardioides sp.]